MSEFSTLVNEANADPFRNFFIETLMSKPPVGKSLEGNARKCPLG